MATGGEVAKTVLQTVRDDRNNEASVIRLLGQCMRELSRDIIFPSLDAEWQVTAVTTGPSVGLPVGFQRNLYQCHDGSHFTGSITVFNSKSQLSEQLFDPQLNRRGTRVQGVAAVGSRLYYSPIPAVETQLTIRGQSVPPPITATTNLDEIIGIGFEGIWENYALWKLYSQIEQGIDGKKVDTMYYMNLYLGLKDELPGSIKHGVSMPPPPIAIPERW